MTRLLALISLIVFAGCADDPEPKNGTNNATAPTNNLTECRNYSVEECPSPCVVLTTSCGDLSLSGCFGEERPAGIPCGDLEPEQCQHQSTSDSCDRGTCNWIQTGGCGDAGELIFSEEPVCLPIQDCTPGNEATECPPEHTCWGLTVDPCGGGSGGFSCDACASHFNRCVPNRYIPEE